MAHRLLRDPDSDGWERADFPIVCGKLKALCYLNCLPSSRLCATLIVFQAHSVTPKRQYLCRDMSWTKSICEDAKGMSLSRLSCTIFKTKQLRSSIYDYYLAPDIASSKQTYQFLLS